MTELLIIRHGETAWNTVRRLQGHTDIPLNAEGTRQAKALAYALQNEKLAAVISSDLQRAVQTAGEIARLQGVPTRLDPALRERCYGGFEGLLQTEIPHQHPDAYTIWKSRNPDTHFPPNADGYHGESIREFHTRCLDAFLHYVRQFEGEKIALVAHGGVLECAYRATKNLPLDAAREVTIFNASINRFSSDGQTLQLVQWGDVVHLQDGALDEISTSQ
jgi:2,3-bisphosphoglycerate-dependent phosphoglycerate mutase